MINQMAFTYHRVNDYVVILGEIRLQSESNLAF